jgi:hypothetical protein
VASRKFKGKSDSIVIVLRRHPHYYHQNVVSFGSQTVAGSSAQPFKIECASRKKKSFSQKKSNTKCFTTSYNDMI